MPKTLDELFEEEEARARRELKPDTPEEAAAREARRKADFEQGVRLGWWDKDGNPILSDEDIDEDEEDGEGEE